MTMRCSRCDIAHEETSRCPTELEFERGYRAGFYKGSKESLQLLSDERRAVTELEKHLSAAECGNVALRAKLTTLTARLAEAEADIDRLNQMLRATGYGQGQIDAYADECEARERAEQERDAAREWIRRHYEQWDVRSPCAEDMRAEMPWLEETP